jgi:prepilin-type N-terminal cleavage/methylation domain-containing protein
MKIINNHVSCCKPRLQLHEKECGFTLIELMVTMVMGLIILAGITAMFLSYSKTSIAVSSRTERMGDMYLATQIMHAELRVGKDICWDGTNSRIVYQTQDSLVALGACTSVDASNGSFELKPADSGNNKPTPYVCWNRPEMGGGCQELIRDLDTTTGMTVSVSSGVWTVTLNATHSDEERKSKNMSMSFKTWPRN